jgi:hypothetical protein
MSVRATAAKTIGSTIHGGGPARCEAREVDDLRAALVDLDRHREHQPDERSKHEGRGAGDRAFRPREQEAETDAEEGAEQDEVREVAQMDDVRAQPADQRELEEEDERAREDEA